MSPSSTRKNCCRPAAGSAALTLARYGSHGAAGRIREGLRLRGEVCGGALGAVSRRRPRETHLPANSRVESASWQSRERSAGLAEAVGRSPASERVGHSGHSERHDSLFAATDMVRLVGSHLQKCAGIGVGQSVALAQPIINDPYQEPSRWWNSQGGRREGAL